MQLTLDRAKLKAQRDANRYNVTVTLWNLNTVGAAMYVIRTARPDDSKSHQYVATFHPETIEQHN